MIKSIYFSQFRIGSPYDVLIQNNTEAEENVEQMSHKNKRSLNIKQRSSFDGKKIRTYPNTRLSFFI